MRFLFLLLTIFSLSGCGLLDSIRINNLLKEDRVRQHSFKEKIRFKEVNGRIIIPVKIQNKTYDFLFDTGAITVIDDDVAKLIKLTKIAKRNLTDFSGNKKKLRYIRLDTITIQNIDFLAIGAVVSDLNVLKDNKCIQVSGIIGANVMNNAVWQINYPYQEIIVTDSKDSLFLPFKSDTVSFETNMQGTPSFNLKTSTGINEEVILDTGSDKGIYLPYKNIYHLKDTSKLIKGYGMSYSAFGNSWDTTLFTNLSDVIIGYKFGIENTSVGFKQQLPQGIIGGEFLKRYTVTIDWLYQNIIFSNFAPIEKKLFDTYRFNPTFKDGKILVDYVYEVLLIM